MCKMKNKNSGAKLSMVLILALTALPMNGCTLNRSAMSEARTVRENDKVAVSYTCNLADGSLAVTNQRQVADAPAITRSPLFRMPVAFGPQIMTATAKPVIDPAGHTEMLGFKFKSFEEAVSERLAGRLVGLPYDQEQQVRLSATVPHGLAYKDRYLERFRKTSHRKVLRVPVWQVAKELGKPPVAEARWQGRDGITFVVDSVEGKVVNLRRQIKSGATVQTPFGPAKVIDEGKSYTLNIAPNVGTVVRSGPLVGRITKVTGESFMLDYGNPFGFEDLNCRVLIKEPSKDTATMAKRSMEK